MFLSILSKPKKSQTAFIRPAEAKDFSALEELFFEFYTRFNMEQTLTGVVKDLLRVDDARAFARDAIQSYFDDKGIIYVAEVENQVIGYISGSVEKKKHYIFSPEAEIIDWFVTGRYRNLGIGKQLYEVFLKRVKTMGCQAITLEAFYQNVDTVQTYERMGFVRDSLILKKKI